LVSCITASSRADYPNAARPSKLNANLKEAIY
jgi:hypothetical protein